jgi:triacylglycerol esterase/lipase EstA (alpha/beta hydrolase family)
MKSVKTNIPRLRFKSRSLAKFGATLALVCSVVIQFSSTANAQAVVLPTARPIVFIHGFNVFGLPEDCKADWSKMEAGLQADGYTGPMVTAGFYFNDINCDVITSPHGTIMSKSIDMARDLAWYFYNTYNQNGTAIDVVAHSYGGLLTRYALYRVAIGDPSFPPFLNVAHVSTVGSPYEGYAILAESCHIIVWNLECDEMFPLSSFIKELNSPPASYPQGVNGTIWSNGGSNADPIDSSDGLVGSASATSMNVSGNRKLILPWYKFVFHTLYTRNSEVIAWIAQTLSTDVASANVIAKVDESLPMVLGSADAVVSQSEVVQDVTALPANQKPAHLAPYLVNGVQQGVQFTQVLAGGMFDHMGIKEGDVVQGCSAATINTPSFPIDGLKKHGKGKMKLCIVRNGVKKTHIVSVQ